MQSIRNSPGRRDGVRPGGSPPRCSQRRPRTPRACRKESSISGSPSPVPVETGKKIEVIDVFSYGCPHCSDLDPHLAAWAKTLPADVDFKRVPIDFGREQWATLAKIYFTYEAMGVEPK